MSRNIVFEGWLTKSPPNRRIWRTVSSTLAWHFTFVDRRWRRRWFALRQSGELPGQYFLDYYADRNCRRLKGTIDLDLCEQVDAGLHMERNGQAPLNPNLRGSVFTIQTQRRTYHLEADCEAEMEKWVDAICRVCGLRATEDVPPATVTRHNALDCIELKDLNPGPSTEPDTYQNNLTAITAMNDHYECPDGTGPYIPISECITGVRAPDEQRLFTFEPKTIAIGTRNVGQQYTSQPHIRINSELSENDSNLSDEDDGSFHASHQNLPDWAVTKTFTKLSVAPNMNDSEDGPPVPPRPPKTFAGRNREVPQKDPFQGPKIQEPVEVHDNSQHTQQRLRVPRRMSQGAPSSPRQPLIPVVRCPEEEEEFSPGHASMQYCNLPSLPPAVDRNLKPRHSSHSIGHINALPIQEYSATYPVVMVHCESCTCAGKHCQCCECRKLDERLINRPVSPNALITFTRSDAYPCRMTSRSLPQRCWPARSPSPPGRAPSPRPKSSSQHRSSQSVRPSQLHIRQSSPSSRSEPPRTMSRRSQTVLPPPRPLPPIQEVETPTNTAGGFKIGQGDEKPDVLQYLDLDLHTTKPPQAKGPEPNKPNKKFEITHGKSMSAVDTDAYKTVDFLKTEAFNITRQDAEASRSFQY